MKKQILILLGLLLFCQLFAQTVITIGTENSSQRQPFGIQWGYERTSALYTATELQGLTGNITALGWCVQSTSTYAVPLKIYIKNTTASAQAQMTWNNMLAGATLVYQSTLTFSSASWRTISLTTPFNYTGGNIMVLCETNYGGEGNPVYPTFNFSHYANTHQYWFGDNTPPVDQLGSINNGRANIKITISPASGLDLAVNSVDSPLNNSYCTTSDSVRIKIKNMGTETVNFNTTNATLDVSITKPDGSVHTMPQTQINNGTLSPNVSSSIFCGMASFNTIGSYTINSHLTITGDNNSNNYLSTTITKISSEPIFQITPTSKDFGTCNVGDETASQTFVVTNLGTGELVINSAVLNSPDFVVMDGNTYPATLTSNASMSFAVKFVPMSAGQKNVNMVITESGSATHDVNLLGFANDYNYGGGDASTVFGGYYFSNNINQSTFHPMYNWIEMGQMLSLYDITGCSNNGSINQGGNGTTDDGYFGPVTLPFTFNFYGNDYTTVYIGTNGLLTFGSGTSNMLNRAIPTATIPNNFIAAFWSDMEFFPNSGSRIYYGGNAYSFVITFDHLGVSGGSLADWVTAQVILYSDGHVKIQYLAKSDELPLNACSVGIENQQGTKGVQYAFNGAGGSIFRTNSDQNVAVLFSPQQNLLVQPVSIFNITTEENTINLHWTEDTNPGIAGYYVYRGLSSNYNNAVQVTNQFITNGVVSGNDKNFTFQDPAPVNNSDNYYWLKAMTTNGNPTMIGPLKYHVVANNDVNDPALTDGINSIYPNPFNPSTTISFSLAKTSQVKLEIYNLKGQLVRTLIKKEMAQGTHSVEWNGKNGENTGVASGIYFCRLTIPDKTQARKLMVVK